jgi:Transposase DDE domain group 1
VDLAVMLADGGEAISDLAVLRDQPGLFGEVASTPTAWRTLEAIDDDCLARIAAGRAAARERAWELGADPGFYVIDIDATLIGAHSEKERAAPTDKRGFGFHPLGGWLDGTGEALACLLRPGNAGSGTAGDHVAVLGAALVQVPTPASKVIARADSAGMSHGFLGACTGHHTNKPQASAEPAPLAAY